MGRPHSSVNYIEPNTLLGYGENGTMNDWAAEDSSYNVPRAPRLEDYCIALNIAVEISNRKTDISLKDEKRVIVMEYKTSNSDGKSTVNFMGGTRIKCHDVNDSTVDYLTTNYADMYVEDLVDYGTTEMIGIKSVDVQYQASCVPIITVNFTDVRGLSLFQPVELNRVSSYNSVTNINASNVAQVFFQCFFQIPVPKYTIFIKGFYGKPVSYQVLCDKFETKFNAASGDFDVIARFIGYSYSFLTDISMDALIAAPYSDYLGKAYWKSKVDEGKFVIPNKEGINMPMPTLFEAMAKIKMLACSGNSETQVVTITEEEKDHSEEIAALSNIRDMYTTWYEKLYTECKNKYGKKYCHSFTTQVSEDKSLYDGLLILVNSKNNNADLSDDYDQFSSDFKKINLDLYSAIERYNSCSGSYRKLDNISIDFSDYKRQPIFNLLYVNNNNDIIFNDFDKSTTVPRTKVKNQLFSTKNIRTSASNDEIYTANEQYKKYVLYNIYNDGVDQYVNCYYIDPYYKDIQERINALQNDKNRSISDKEKEKKKKQLNADMFNKMGWYPSIENFTRIMMAHFETLMHIMYTFTKSVGERTAAELGATIGEGGNLPDIKMSLNDIVPPFPRVTEHVTEDGVTKVEDVWVGTLTNGKGFVEVDVINGFFNAIEEMRKLYNDAQQSYNEIERANQDSNNEGGLLLHPMTSFDFFLTKSPYGDNGEMVNDTSEGKEFAGKVAIRMFNILSLNFFRNEFGDKWVNMVSNIAKSEAENFYKLIKATNTRFINTLKTIDAKTIIDIITTKDETNPWGSDSLFGLRKNNNLWLEAYYIKSKGLNIYPIQNVSFSRMKQCLEAFRSGKQDSVDGDVTISKLPKEFNNYDIFINNNRLYNIARNGIKEDYKHVKTLIDNSNSSSSDSYGEIYNKISASFANSEAIYDEVILKDESSSVGGEILFEKVSNGQFDGISIVSDEGIRIIQSLGEEYHKKPLKIDNDIKYKKCAMALFAIKAIDYNQLSQKFKLADKGISTFACVPKLAMLQIGAAICEIGFYHDGNLNPLAYSRLVESKKDENGIHQDWVGMKALSDYISNLNSFAALSYVKEFKDWCNENYTLIPDSVNDLTIEVLNKLIKSIFDVSFVTKLNINYFKGRGSDNYKLDVGIAESYLSTFIEKLKELYKIGYAEDENGNITQITEEPKETTDAMKIELYRYLKQIYDKWIPTTTFEDWELDTFFDRNVNGHNFYFIDSYYNNVGQKVLINPIKLADRISQYFETLDVNSMMLGFMGDIYAENKCMLKCIQNFNDLGSKDGMKDMFIPMPYNGMSQPSEYPSFVVIYPYEPSKNLNIEDSDFADDGFMLNDEMDTPMAIKTKVVDESDKCYRIPAFGVSYGSQYQSFFTNVNVDMSSPIATQQSIKLKNFILQQSMNQASKPVASAQDMYDVYSTQSYTCSVDMMGCAWVQPMMYFVLLNIPMFRGSYLIMSVTHKITPGNMVTSFKGCRMANVSNHIVEDMFFLEEDVNEGSDDEITSVEKAKFEKADVDNDCPYKVFPLNEDSNTELSGDEIKDGLAIMDKLIEKGFKEVAAAGIVGNMYVEGYDYKNTKKRFKYDLVTNDLGLLSGGLCQWRNENLYLLASKNPSNYGKGTVKLSPTEENVTKYTNILKENGLDYQLEFLKESMSGKGNSKKWVAYSIDSINKLNSPRTAAEQFQKNYERPKKLDSVRGDAAEKYYKEFKSRSSLNKTTESSSADGNKDVRELLFNAIQKSCYSTPSINVKLKKKDVGNNTMSIYQDGGSENKLGKVFDVILNGYSEHFKELCWCYNVNGLQLEPISLKVTAVQKADENERIVTVNRVGDSVKDTTHKFTANDKGSVCKTLLRAVYKRLKELNGGNPHKEIPQFTDVGIFDDIKIQPCGELVPENSDTYDKGKTYDGYTAKIDRSKKYGSWPVGEYVDSLNYWRQNVCEERNRNRSGYGSCSLCTSVINRALRDVNFGGSKYWGGEPWEVYDKMKSSDSDFVEIQHGTCSTKQHFKFNTPPKAGDICLMWDKRGSGVIHRHTCSFDGEHWISDFVQNNCNVYTNSSKVTNLQWHLMRHKDSK